MSGPAGTCLQRRDRRGFTLIEVLVVVVTIALLMAIMIPSLVRMRREAQSVACKANLHDLGTAFTVYAETQQGWFPLTPSVTIDSYRSLYTARLLPDVEVLICPATRNVVRPGSFEFPTIIWSSPEGQVLAGQDMDGDHLPDADIDRTARGGPQDSSGGHSYEYNAYYNGIAPTAPPPLQSDFAGRHKQRNHFRFRPDRILLVHDNDDATWAPTRQGCENASNGSNNCPQPWDNHGEEGMNMMFGDGHAEWVKKLAGTYTDESGAKHQSDNASIDRVWLLSQYPWLFAN